MRQLLIMDFYFEKSFIVFFYLLRNFILKIQACHVEVTLALQLRQGSEH